MYPFLHFTLLISQSKVNLRRDALVRVDTIAGIQELNQQTCKIILERRDGTTEEYTVEEKFDILRERLDAIYINHNPTGYIEKT